MKVLTIKSWNEEESILHTILNHGANGNSLLWSKEPKVTYLRFRISAVNGNPINFWNYKVKAAAVLIYAGLGSHSTIFSVSAI